MVFAILYGFFCGCFLSLVSAVAAKIYGADRLAGLSGLILLFNAPGYAAGAPIGGAILGATGNNWQVVAGYSGAVQVFGALCLLYGACPSSCHWSFSFGAGMTSSARVHCLGVSGCDWC